LDLLVTNQEESEDHYQVTLKELTADGLNITIEELDILVSKLSQDEYDTIRHYLISEDEEAYKSTQLIINKYLK